MHAAGHDLLVHGMQGRVTYIIVTHPGNGTELFHPCMEHSCGTKSYIIWNRAAIRVYFLTHDT